MNEIKLEQANQLRNRIASLADMKSEFLRKMSEFEQQDRMGRVYGVEPHERTELVDLARKAFVAGLDLKIQEASTAFEQL